MQLLLGDDRAFPIKSTSLVGAIGFFVIRDPTSSRGRSRFCRQIHLPSRSDRASLPSTIQLLLGDDQTFTVRSTSFVGAIKHLGSASPSAIELLRSCFFCFCFCFFTSFFFSFLLFFSTFSSSFLLFLLSSSSFFSFSSFFLIFFFFLLLLYLLLHLHLHLHLHLLLSSSSSFVLSFSFSSFFFFFFFLLSAVHERR